jgi:hypothetical protein
MTTSVSGTRTDTVDTDAVDTSILGDPTSAEDAGATPPFHVRR